MSAWVGDLAVYGSASGATAVIPKPTGTLQAGDVIVFGLREQGTISGTNPITTPANVFRAGPANGAADRAQGLFYYIVTDPATVPASFTFGGFTSGRGAGWARARRGFDIAALIAGGPAYSTTDLASFVASGVPFTYITMWGDERTSPRSHVPSSTPAGFATIANIQNTLDGSTTGSRTALWAGSMSVNASGSTTVPAAALTWPDGVSANRSVGAAFRDLPDGPIGYPVKLGNGASARLSYLDGAGVRKAPSRVAIWFPGFDDVEALIAKPGATMAHRGGSSNWPEYAELSYDRCVFRGFGPLEFSCGFTLDNVPFGLGDQYLDRAAGVSGNVDPTTMSWATLAATYRNVLRPLAPGVTQPFYRLEDFLKKYTPTQVVLVDPKFGWSTPARVAAMLDLCDAYGGPEKIVIKYDFPVTSSALVDAAHARTRPGFPNGYRTMNYWGTDQAALTPAYHTDKWDLIGVRYDADQAMYDAAAAIGKPVWAAVIPDQAGYDLAASRGADLMMVSNVAGVAPVSSR